MTVWGKGLSAISCASLIENLVDKQFVHHHQTSKKLVAKRDGGPSNKVKTFGGQTVGGGCNHELNFVCSIKRKNNDYSKGMQMCMFAKNRIFDEKKIHVEKNDIKMRDR